MKIFHQLPAQRGWLKRRIVAKLCRMTTIFIVTLTVTANIVFIVDPGYKSKHLQSLPVTDSENHRQDVPIDSNRDVVGEARLMMLEMTSSKSTVSVVVNGVTILDDNDLSKGRGIHVIVLNEETASVMSSRLFDTYSPHEDEALALFINMITSGRVIVLAIKDEGTFHLKQAIRNLLQRFGSTQSQNLGWRDMWVLVIQKDNHQHGRCWCEQISKSPDFHTWAQPIQLQCQVPLVEPSVHCQWSQSEEDGRRREFCDRVEGYGSVCHCLQPAPITFQPAQIETNHIADVPVAVIASNRPYYLYRMLRSLLSATGARSDMITVFIDGYYEEPMQVARLFGLRAVQHTPVGSRNARISQHYRASLSVIFNLFPAANKAIIIEEDLDVSPDFFHYFNQLAYLLDEDDTLYCISAWNDHGYQHSSHNESQLYRVETMPGLGWMLTSRLYKQELEASWPSQDKMWDWDMWMRRGDVRRNRECIIPDISRTYHFGASGFNMNSYFQDIYFRKRSINNIPYVRLHHTDSLKAAQYEQLLEKAITSAKVVDHNLSPCDASFIPEVSDDSFVVYVKMDNAKDTKTWLRVAKCFQIWDLDARGSHKGLWRFYLKGHPIFVIGAPFSQYSIFKPSNVTPIYIEPVATRRKKQRSLL